MKIGFYTLMAALLAIPAVAQDAGSSGGLIALPENTHGTLTDDGSEWINPSEKEAEASFLEAHEAYRTQFASIAGTTPTPTTVEVFSDPMQHSIAGGSFGENIKLSDLPIVIDVENKSLKEIVTEIVSQAAATTGPWTVKWRLKPDNLHLMDERVNLTAEAEFGAFLNMLSERVRNMTGTSLYFKTFNQSRVLMIADTYY